MTYAKRLTSLSVCTTLVALLGCSGEQSTGGSGGASSGGKASGGAQFGGSTAAGGMGFGGASSGGTASGGAGQGGTTASGGSSDAGGSVSGGASNGGSSSGGSSSGGSSAGGSSAGASSTGGSTSGGSNSGGSSSGGAAASGGSTSGGSSSGGAATSGGVSSGGASKGGATSGGAATGGAASGGTSATGGATNGCPVKVEGFATVNANSVNGTTGGGNATPTTVTTFAALKAAAQDSAARVIIVSGTIKTTDESGFAMDIKSNKTIIGANKSATIYGGIVMNSVSNIIIRNLNIQGVYPNSGPDDTVASHGSHHIWYDHLAIWDAGDGLLDITNQSNYQTVSWTKFYYTNSANGHRLASLNGSGGGDHPEDSRYLKVTYHHNWWGALVNERMPRVMYGQGHQYNNYFNSPGNLYCIGVGSFGSVLVENNYFKDVKSPHIFMYDWHMYVAASGNVYDNTTGNKDTGMAGSRDTNDPALNAGVQDAAAFTPPYTYTLDKAADVPALVQKCAGPQ
ncbi:MAG: hypothetical protein QM756_25765 [Polyangiaceae bacterium]